MENVTLEEVIEKAKALPPEEQQQFGELLEQFGHFLFDEDVWALLEVIQSLKPEELQSALLQLLEKQKPILLHLPESRKSLARHIRGKYAHIQTSSERFAQLKQEEIKLEDSRR